MIRIENLNYAYKTGAKNQKQALVDINLEIADNSLTALIGHTGSGKSTLIRHLNGLIKPDSGKIFIDDTEITAPKADLRKVRFNVGLVFQYPEQQLFAETVYKDIAFGPENMKLGADEVNRRVYEAAEMVGLLEKSLEKSPFELSGGQQRRAAIAEVLAMKPKNLIMDEPAAGLDPRGRDEIFALIKRLHKSGMTILFTSHSMEDAAKTAERVIVMDKGKIFAEGSVAEIFARGGELRKIGLDAPQVTMIADKLRALGYDIPPVYTVEQMLSAVRKIIGGKNG